ncbi:MAG: SH3 domain-containing protein [Cyanobacteria bacterium J06649_4]
MKNFLLGLSKFVLGIILAMLIMTLAGASMLRYFMARTAEPPARPTYDNDLPEDRPAASAPSGEDTDTGDELVAEPESEPEPDPEPEPAADGSYSVYVTQPVGLILRDGPSTEYANVGGIAYNQSVTVIGEDSGWLNVVLSSGQEGWIKDGNTARE